MATAKHRHITFSAAAAAAPSVRVDGDRETFVALGYRQTLAPAAQGGKANANGFRIRNEALQALAESYAGQPFLTGHARGDVRARGGTILEAWTEQVDDTGEIALMFEIEPQAAWAKEGLANGTIDRFSIGASPGDGEIVCTVHGVPVWSTDECFCFPGEMVTVERDGEEVELQAEWEYEQPDGEELSAVNVPAVDGTGIVRAEAEPNALAGDRAARLRELAALCGREHPELVLERATWRRSPAPPTVPAPAPAPAPPSPDPAIAAIAASLGLAAGATTEQLRARADELRARVDQEHVESTFARLIASHEVGYGLFQDLRATFAAEGRAAFDRDVALIERIAPARSVARPMLQSDAPPANTDPMTYTPNEIPTDGPDAWERHAFNPAMPMLMRQCGLTPDDIRKHGPRSIPVLPNLGALIDATAKRKA
jgi:hypothetical protein